MLSFITLYMNSFLPVNRTGPGSPEEGCYDFVLVTGDAYTDHPSFGAAVISRWLSHLGYTVGIISQPDWKTPDSFRCFGRPKLAFLVTSGNIDSMVARYTSLKKPRNEDLYSPGGKTGRRPDRALIVYTSAIRQAYSNAAVILGGLEASLRRLSHYDYWSDSVRRSVLADSKADLIVYGMGERQIKEIAARLAGGEAIGRIRDVRGTVIRTSDESETENALMLHPYEEAASDKILFAENFALSYRNTDPVTAKKLAEKTGSQYIIQNPPAFPLEREELDEVYSLPYTRKSHPVHDTEGGVPALREVSFSITGSRGCFGACSFCSIAFHQGRSVRSRSHESVITEAKQIVKDPGFTGYIHDIGGPTANFTFPSCRIQLEKGCCERRCLAPEPCGNLEVSHRDYISLLEKLRKIEGVKKVFIRSGIRFDYLMLDRDVAEKRKGNFLEVLCTHHISGQLKVAPEHVSDNVLTLMGKPPGKVYEAFTERFNEENKKLGKKQYLVPYFISSHPGSTLSDAIELALYLKKSRFIPDQVQDFYPTPGTLSTCMYYTGLDPLSLAKRGPDAGNAKKSTPGRGGRGGKRSGSAGEKTAEPVKVYSATTEGEKRMQKALIHFHKPENYFLVKKALQKAGRTDLIGNHPGALIPATPPREAASPERGGPGGKAGQAEVGKKERNGRERGRGSKGQQKKKA